MTCPYSVLGLDKNASQSEVRSKYIELAKLHHPDKLVGKTEEEILKNENKFKDITDAYQKICNNNNNDYIENEQDWMNKIWIFLKDPEVWESIKDIMEKISKKNNKHLIRVPVSLEEIHCFKTKKLRIFLKNIIDPIFCNLDCSKYPGYTYIHNDEITINFVMELKSHMVFRNDNLLNMWDLYTTAKITLYEYINGVNIVCKYLDDTNIIIKLPAFSDFKKAWVEKGKGLQNKGDLYICYELKFPTKEQWNQIDDNKKSDILNALKSLG